MKFTDGQVRVMNKGILYLCATPIGNLGDISQRCLETLASVDLIAAEDTRHTLKLLNHFGIKTPMTSYYEHNKREKGDYLLKLLEEGKNIAVVTDAGTPAVSDPGEDLVRSCIDMGIAVTGVPGASAAICALTLSGLPTGRFCFEGFLSVNRRQRRAHLDDIKSEKRTMIFYEAPHKLCATLNDLYETLGERRIALARELTKRHEELIYTTLSGAIQKYADASPKGEYVLILEGLHVSDEENPLCSLGVEDHMAHYLKAGSDEMSAIKAVARDRGMRKNEIYAMVKKKPL